MVGSRVRENGTLSYLGVARGCWLSIEDHLGEKNSPIYTTHRWWVTRPRNRKHKFVHGACERKSVQENLAHRLVEGHRDQQSCRGFKL